MKAVLDPPEFFPELGESRCRHDMLAFHGRSTCAICLRLPDFPILDLGHVDDSSEPTTWPITVETRIDCVRCRKPLKLGHGATYSTREGGVVGECCEVPA